ncbi:hypothetical protein P5V15_012741 [Pogonomyrmex californicus]
MGNNFGHVAKNCRVKLTQSKDNMFCRYCKEKGHFLENCQLKIASNNRRKNTSQENSNGSLRSSSVQREPETSYTPFENSRVQVDKNAPEIRSVTVNLDKHNRVPTVQVKIRNITDDVTLMLDTGSGPNIIKENLIPEVEKINYTNILKLNDINKYPVYTLREITLILFNKPVTFHIVADDFRNLVY